jgi:hypothetical protein
MNGLRIYTPNASVTSDVGKTVFYSRRGSGPYYRWRYDESGASWHPSRMHAAEFSMQSFDNANWKSLPPALKTRLSEHYLD